MEGVEEEGCDLHSRGCEMGTGAYLSLFVLARVVVPHCALSFPPHVSLPSFIARNDCQFLLSNLFRRAQLTSGLQNADRPVHKYVLHVPTPLVQMTADLDISTELEGLRLSSQEMSLGFCRCISTCDDIGRLYERIVR